MLSTVHQRNIEKLFQEKEQISLTELKKICVDSSEMNQTTLYRILDRWKNEGKLHELLIDKERVFLYCSSPLEDAGVKMSYCQGCQRVQESHFPLPINTLKAENIEHTQSCRICQSSEM